MPIPASSLEGGTNVWESLFAVRLLSLMIDPPILYAGRAEADREAPGELGSVLFRDRDPDLIGRNGGKIPLKRPRVRNEG